MNTAPNNRQPSAEASRKTMEKYFPEHGSDFLTQGYYMDEDHLVAYLNAEGHVIDYYRRPLGTYRVTSSWPVGQARPRVRLHQVYIQVGPWVYQCVCKGPENVFRAKRSS